MLATSLTSASNKKAEAVAVLAVARAIFINGAREVQAGIFGQVLRARGIDTTGRLRTIIQASGYLLYNDNRVVLIRPSFIKAAAPATPSPTVPAINKSIAAQPAVTPSALSRATVPSVVGGSSRTVEEPYYSTVITDDDEPITTTQKIEPLSFNCDTDAIRYVLEDLDIDDLDLEDIGLTDIFIDVGGNMSAKISGKTVQLRQTIELSDVEAIMERLPARIPTEKQNRVIFGNTLHRLAAVMYDGEISGITIRVGRKVSGLLPVFEGMVEGKNVLLCGAPNVGKTTSLRDLCSYLSRDSCLCLIDTSGEVCGDAGMKTQFVGTSRVFRPEDPDKQYAALIDCVRNHSPDIIAIDELNTKQEVEVCQTIALRSIRMIACIHGNIEDLLYNSKLNKTLGGSTEALVSDMNAIDGRKVVHQRSTRPIFDVVINIKRTPVGLEYTFIDDVSNNVRDMLEGKPIQTVTRTIIGDEIRETTEETLFPCAI